MIEAVLIAGIIVLSWHRDGKGRDHQLHVHLSTQVGLVDVRCSQPVMFSSPTAPSGAPCLQCRHSHDL